jgi:hypothetical protein
MRLSVGFHRLAVEDWEEFAAFGTEAERLGVADAWPAEAWAHDAVTPLAYLAAKTSAITLGAGIIQAGTRTSAPVAMTALSLAGISGAASCSVWAPATRRRSGDDSGRRTEAMALKSALPDADEMVTERIRAYRDAAFFRRPFSYGR